MITLRAVLPLLTLFACTTAEGEPARMAKANGEHGPIVVELFTSQGCSSCPPADRLLSKIAKAGEVAGKRVAPLSFHVDYWNDLGWEDPYSRAAWTDRQRGYARALGDRSVYTPQLVVGGTSGMVGSVFANVKMAIAATPYPALLAANATWTAEYVEVTATAPAGADVFVAVWEDSQRVKVTRGENRGETLAHDRVVRRFERVAPAGTRKSLRIPLDGTWKSVGAIAFAQRGDKRIVASAMLPR